MILVLCLWIVFSRPVHALPEYLPLNRILLSLEKADEAEVRKVAALQATEKSMDPKGPKYGSSPVENNDPQKVVDDKVFIGCFVPLTEKTKLAIFSDDGCDVWIDGVQILANFGKGQHLPDLKQSFHILNFQPQVGKMHHIMVHYSNTIYNGKTDIDGCTLFAYDGGAKLAGVQFENTSRGGDKVVSAKDVEKGMPGGVKTLTVRTTPAGATVNLEIKAKPGAKKPGTAVFLVNGKEETKAPAKDGEVITIHGRNISGEPRDMLLEATMANAKMPCGDWDFTVFRVDLSLLPNGQEIPENAVALQEKPRDLIPLRNIAKLFSEKTTVGMYRAKTKLGNLAGGSSLTVGKIVPPGMKESDFFRSVSRGYNLGNGFFVRRHIWSRTYLNSCFAITISSVGAPSNVNDADDTLLPGGRKNTSAESLDPTPKSGDLYLYSLDVPYIDVSLGLIMPVKSVFRARLNFRDRALYADVVCSDKLDWHMAQSIARVKVTPGDAVGPLDDYQRDPTYDGPNRDKDNSVGAGWVSLSPTMAGKPETLPPLPPLTTITRVLSPNATGFNKAPLYKNGSRFFARTDPLKFTFDIRGKGFPFKKTAKIEFREVTGKGPLLKTLNGDFVSIEQIKGQAEFANRDAPGIYLPMVTVGKDCVFGLGIDVTYDLIGPPAKYVITLQPGQKNSFTGQVLAVDALNVPEIPITKPAPTLKQNGGNVDFVISDIKADETQVIPAYKFTLTVNKPAPKGPYTIKLKAADGNGVTGEAEFTFDKLPGP